jgi:hypothetical protein
MTAVALLSLEANFKPCPLMIIGIDGGDVDPEVVVSRGESVSLFRHIHDAHVAGVDPAVGGVDCRNFHDLFSVDKQVKRLV